MLKLLKNLVKFILFNLMNLFVFPSKTIRERAILLIRLDAIGDYVLFRNFIEILKKSRKYGSYKITLLGNIAWKELAGYLDKEFVDKFIWLDRKKFNKNPIYRWRKLREITSRGYELVVNPRYSREFYFDDIIVNLIKAKEKIGGFGDLSNIKKWQKRISDRYYTKLIPAENKIMFEFYRNKEFFENLLGVKLGINKPSIDIEKVRRYNFKEKLPARYVVLFISASAKFRKWNVENFLKVAKYLAEKGFQIVLCGGEEDISDKKIVDKLPSKILNLIGETSLLDMVYVIYRASLLITNETFTQHVAAAVNIPVIVIFNGNHFGRFVPYPREITKKYYPTYHPEIEKDLDDYKKLSNSYGYGSKLNIGEISCESVINRIDEILRTLSS